MARQAAPQSISSIWRTSSRQCADWLGAAAAPDKGRFWQTHFGALKDDPYLEAMLQEIYRRRGRPETDES